MGAGLRYYSEDSRTEEPGYMGFAERSQTDMASPYRDFCRQAIAIEVLEETLDLYTAVPLHTVLLEVDETPIMRQARDD